MKPVKEQIRETRNRLVRMGSDAYCVSWQVWELVDARVWSQVEARVAPVYSFAWLQLMVPR